MSVTPENLLPLFIKLKDGDDKAFSFFYKYFINDLYAYGKSLGAEDKYLMDAIQDVFLKAFFEKLRFESVEHFKYFLLKSLKNRIYDLYKSKSFLDTTGIEDELPDFSIKVTVLDRIIQEEDRDIIRKKIDKLLNVLSPQQKEAIYLRYIQELDYMQIAEMMNIPEVSVRQLVSRAIKKIRKDHSLLPLLGFIILLCSRL